MLHPGPSWQRLRRRAAFVTFAFGAAAGAGCSGCDGGSAASQAAASQAAASQAAAASDAASALPALPDVALVPTVTSTKLARWPSATRALGPQQVAALLPLTESGRIELHDPGLEPRTIFRHHLEAGSRATLLLEIDLGLHVEQDGATTVPSVPALTVAVAVATRSVEGDIATVSITIETAELRPRGEEAIDQEIAEQLGPIVKRLPGVTATFQVTAQGLRANAPTPPTNMPKELNQLWTSVGEAVSDAVVTFPADAIGAGARWSVLDRQARAGAVMLRKTEFTLLDVSDDALRLSGLVVEAAIGGTARDPALPREITLEVLDGVTLGKRRHTLRIGQLWPLASSSELSSDLTLRATASLDAGTDTKTSQVKLTEILKTVRADAAPGIPDAGAELP